MNKPIAITMGDPAGIGPEIIVKAFRDSPQDMQGCVVVGDVATMQREALLPVVRLQSLGDYKQLPAQCIPVLEQCELPSLVAYGQVSGLAGKAAAQCAVWAADAALRGDVAAIVTAPLHKKAMALSGLNYPGHTELLQARAALFLGKPVSEVPVRMMLANDELKVVLVSVHLPLRDAVTALTFDRLLQTLQITHQFAPKQRIAVAGLNPHAGEDGMFGQEEIEIITPAIEAARAQGINAAGPFAPDTIFMRARKNEFDVVVAMYHDQGLIPVKYLGVEQGVNVTLGLPLVRTSPDHGTAFDIAGAGRADPSSLIAALRMARRLIA